MRGKRKIEEDNAKSANYSAETEEILTLLMLNPDIPCLCKSVDSDSRYGSALFAIKYMNL